MAFIKKDSVSIFYEKKNSVSMAFIKKEWCNFFHGEAVLQRGNNC